MKRTFDASVLKYGLKWENIEIEILEKTVKFTMMKKLANDKLIYNTVEIDKGEFFEFLEEVDEDEVIKYG